MFIPNCTVAPINIATHSGQNFLIFIIIIFFGLGSNAHVNGLEVTSDNNRKKKQSNKWNALKAA